MQQKRKLVLIPSAYSHRAMGDIEGFIPLYKNDFDVYVITDEIIPKWEMEIDGVHYVQKGTRKAVYLEVTADYVIDAGTISGSNKYSNTQKRICVWHGTPYKKMFRDLGEEHVVTAYDYASAIDLMVSPSEWYTNRFLRQSMLYSGEVLETAVSRTDSLFIDDAEKRAIAEELGIPNDKKVLLYAPTFREKGQFDIPFSPERILQTLGNDWVIVAKLHYLNYLEDYDQIIDATEYESVNKLLAMADLLVTDYSSLLFDYSVLGKPALLYQYDRTEYEETRSFMFNMEDFVSSDDIVFTESDFCKRLESVEAIGDNLAGIRLNFYPYQKKNSTQSLVSKLNLNSTPREIGEIVFLVNDLNQIGGVHSFVLNLAREFKEKYNAKIIVLGYKEFDGTKDEAYFFDSNDVVDIKLSAENNSTIVNSILACTNGYIISCQYWSHYVFQRFLAEKKSVLMFHGDTKDVVDRNMYTIHLDGYNEGKIKNYRRLALLTKGNRDLLSAHLNEDVAEKAIFMENGIPFDDAKNLYMESGDFAFVSRLDPDKNPLEIIEIFSNPNLNPAYRLHIYGDGMMKNEIETIIEERGLGNKIILHGFVSEKEEIYRNKQGVLLASKSEGLPLTLIESIKFGIPVYSYDSFTACKDIVTESTGIRIPPEDREAFVAALNAPFDINHFDGNETRSRFSNEVVTKKWKALFDELDSEVAQEELSLAGQEEDTGDNLVSKLRSSKKKGKLSTRVKKKVRKTAIFKKNNRYTRLAVWWKYMKNPWSQQGLPLVSIVMPFYNNSATVEAAVKSVAKSRYRNYEIILVNDGSSEDPTELIKKYHNVRYFYKENGGLGSARNYGVEHAQGKYVLYLDSDDTLYPGSLNKMVAYAEENDLGLVLGKTIRHYVNTGKEETWYKDVYFKTYINEKADRHCLIDDTIATAKLYNLELLKSMGLQFQDGLYEDIPYTGRLYAELDRIGIVASICQKWMVYGTGTSITTSLTLENCEARLNNTDAVFVMHDGVTKVYYARQYIRHHLIACIYGFLNYSDEDKRRLFQLMREGILLRQPYILDKLIVMPSKKMLYKSLINNDFETFSAIASGYSARFISQHRDDS